MEHPNFVIQIRINVGISSRGASQIMGVLEPLGLAWGTDSMLLHNLHQSILMTQMQEDRFLIRTLNVNLTM